MSPLYEYKCLRCNNVTEEFRPVDTQKIICPICGKYAIRQISLPANRVFNWGTWDDFGKKKFGFSDSDLQELKKSKKGDYQFNFSKNCTGKE